MVDKCCEKDSDRTSDCFTKVAELAVKQDDEINPNKVSTPNFSTSNKRKLRSKSERKLLKPTSVLSGSGEFFRFELKDSFRADICIDMNPRCNSIGTLELRRPKMRKLASNLLRIPDTDDSPSRFIIRPAPKMFGSYLPLPDTEFKLPATPVFDSFALADTVSAHQLNEEPPHPSSCASNFTNDPDRNILSELDHRSLLRPQSPGRMALRVSTEAKTMQKKTLPQHSHPIVTRLDPAATSKLKPRLSRSPMEAKERSAEIPFDTPAMSQTPLDQCRNLPQASLTENRSDNFIFEAVSLSGSESSDYYSEEQDETKLWQSRRCILPGDEEESSR